MTNLNDEGISGLYPNLGGLDGDQKFGYPLLPELRLDKGKDEVFENQYGRNNEDKGKFLYNSFNQGGYEGILGGSIGFKGYEMAGFGTSKDKYCKSVRLSEDDDELLCCITNETMKDPVITPYGHCFEKSAIEEWLGKNNTCPITSKPLEISQLFPCYALKKIIDRLE
jgi:hypothetical protein